MSQNLSSAAFVIDAFRVNIIFYFCPFQYHDLHNYFFTHYTSNMNKISSIVFYYDDKVGIIENKLC